MSIPAPVLTVSGKTIAWKAISGTSSYVFVRKVTGHPDEYSIVKGTSITPPDVPGATVRYGLRANLPRAPWAKEVSIAYPVVPPVPLPPVPPAPPAPVPPQAGRFTRGIVVGSAIAYELRFASLLGAPVARMEFGIASSVATLAPIVDAYARAGIRCHLMAGFHERLPTEAEARNVASWAAAFGPGGSFWQGKSYPAVPVLDIEFGNETSYYYQFGDNSAGAYASRAVTYGQRFALAASAARGANPKVRLLAIADGNSVPAWNTNVAKGAGGAQTLDGLAGGFTIHPYGNQWRARIDGTIGALGAVGIRDLTNRLQITEWGLSTDNGRTLSDNYGWNKAMNYDEAAHTLHDVAGQLEALYGGRLAQFFLYAAHDLYPSGTQTGRESYFGALQSNGTTKGAYTTEAMAQLAIV
jgi:hypothetical protein